jgi:phage tail-like protein
MPIPIQGIDFLNPLPAFKFDVEILGLIVGSFSEVSGIESNTEFDEYKEGGVNNFVHRLPRITKYGNLVLKRGISISNALYNWHQDVIIGKIEPKQVDVLLLDNNILETKRWTFKNAIPIKWTGPNLKADSSSIAVESIEFIHQGLQRQLPINI